MATDCRHCGVMDPSNKEHDMNWLPVALDKLDKRVAVFVVATAAVVYMYQQTLEKMDAE